MNTWKWAVCGVALLATAGCSTPRAITALERECRMLEDQVYMLEDELARSDEALQACRSGSVRTSRATTTSERPREDRDSSRLPSLRGPHVTPDASNFKSPVDPRSLRLPDVEVPGSALPSGEFPKSLAPPPRELAPDRSNLPAAPPATHGPTGPTGPMGVPEGAPPFQRKPSAYRNGAYPRRSGADPRGQIAQKAPPRRLERSPQSRPARIVDPGVIPAQAFALDPRADNSRVDRITLNRALTGGYSRESRFGDSGIITLVEPRDAQGQLVPAAGRISVVVLDRGVSGEAARVARWDFTEEQTASLYRRTPHGEGLYLEMPWPGEPPARSHLHLFVRYSTKDGRSVEASREIDVVLPPQRQQGWTQLSPSAPGPEPVQVAKTWQQKPRRYEDDPVQPAAAEEPVREPPPRAVRAAAREPATEGPPRDPAPPATWTTAREPAAASAGHPATKELASNEKPAATTARSTAARLERPVWSPLRP